MKTDDNVSASENEFLSILAHELRNPLANILSTVELAQIENIPKNEATERHITTVTYEVRHIMRVLDRLLDASRVSRKMVDALVLEPLSLHTIILRSISAMDTFMRFSDFKIVYEQNKEVITVNADLFQMTECIVSFLKHIMKQSPQGSVCSISTWTEASCGVIRLHLKVPAAQPNTKHVTPLKSADSDSLRFAQHCIKKHGGSVIENVKHTAFTIRIPLSSGVQGILALDEIKQKEIRRKILVVDDNIIAAGTLTRLLAVRGYETAVAHSGAQGYELALTFKPDIAILDIRMPDFDGYELVSLLRTELPECAFIALTGYGQLRDKKKAFAAGFHFHVTKPASISAIEEILRSISV
jgi:CheY-like chemotaxis protein